MLMFVDVFDVFWMVYDPTRDREEREWKERRGTERTYRKDSTLSIVHQEIRNQTTSSSVLYEYTKKRTPDSIKSKVIQEEKGSNSFYGARVGDLHCGVKNDFVESEEGRLTRKDKKFIAAPNPSINSVLKHDCIPNSSTNMLSPGIIIIAFRPHCRGIIGGSM
jgi:hypothetical protein